MKIIFLDFDGVLIPLDGITIKRTPAQSCVSALNTITQAANASIVISSSWRHTGSIDELRAMLRGWGVRATVIGKTPSIHGRDITRGQEIAEWISSHDVSVMDVVILDDQPIDHPLALRQVMPTPHLGLNDEHAERAIKVLAGKAQTESAIAL